MMNKYSKYFTFLLAVLMIAFMNHGCNTASSEESNNRIDSDVVSLQLPDTLFNSSPLNKERMTLSQQLDKLISKYEVFLARNSFEKVFEKNPGMGLWKDYDNEMLKLRFINDKGICDVLIAHSGNQNNLEFYEIGVVRLLKLEINNELTDDLIRASQRFSEDEDFQFISDEYDNLVELFEPTRLQDTKEMMRQILRRRADLLYR